MAMTATTNTSANTALRYLGINNAASSSSLAKLSSGSRIVRASDDAASLAVGTKIKADVTALKQAQVNASQASSVLQVADGALAQTVDILMRMKALSVQSQSGSVSDNERTFLDKEFQALAAQINAIADQTKFNNTVLLDGTLDSTALPTAGEALSFQVGVASTDVIDFELPEVTLARLGGDDILDADGLNPGARYLADDGSGNPASVAERDSAVVAGNILDAAISQLNEFRSDVGALISRFEFASANLATTIENLDASRSVLLDVDMAAEMSNFSSKQVLLQASVAMLAQANQQPQQLLKLLQ
jgi:flagellin